MGFMKTDERKNNHIPVKGPILFMYAFVFFLGGITMSSCVHRINYTMKEEIVSPDGEFIAVLFINNGNSLSSFRPQVSIIRKSESFRYKNPKAKVFVGYRAKYIDAYWKNAATLVIQHNCLDEYIFRKMETFQGIKIEYVLAAREMIQEEDMDDFEYGDYFRRLYYAEALKTEINVLLQDNRNNIEKVKQYFISKNIDFEFLEKSEFMRVDDLADINDRVCFAIYYTIKIGLLTSQYVVYIIFDETDEINNLA
jgi:hypothetical protein